MLPADRLPLRKEGEALRMLDGVKVLDLTTSIAGPYAGQLLADLGATVVKIEKPKGGDDARAWGPPFLDGESLWYLSVNRNKHSVTLDVGTPDGHALLLRLVEKADVVLLNTVRRAQMKLRLDHATLSAARPGLIHVSLTGFGTTGARSDLACYDLIAEGYSGVMDLTGEFENAPQKVGTPAADLLAGQDAAMAVLAALLRRERTGQGCEIDVSMVESMSRFLAPRISSYMGSGEVPRRSGGRDSVIAIYQVFDTADLPLTLGLGNDGIWARFWQTVGDTAFGERPEYASNAKRRERRDEIVAKISSVLATAPRDHWLERLAQARVPAGPIYRVDELTADAQLQARGFFYAVERNGVRIPQVGLGIRFDGATEGCAKLPPTLGADTSAVFKDWLELSEGDLDDLRNRSIL